MGDSHGRQSAKTATSAKKEDRPCLTTQRKARDRGAARHAHAMNDNLIPALVIPSISVFLCVLIGLRLGEKTYPDAADGRAWWHYRLWWLLTAAGALVGLLAIALWALGVDNLWLHLFLSTGGSILVLMALWGLLSYLLYVYSGRHRLGTALALMYATMILSVLYITFQLGPVGVRLDAWGTAINFANTLDPNVLMAYSLGLVLLLGLPPFLAAAGFFILSLRVKEHSPRLRARVVSLGLMSLFGMAYILPLLFLPFGIQTDTPLWQFGTRLLGQLALLAIYWAYFPPPFIQKAFKIEPLV